MNITRAELAAVIDEAHRRSLKITGHLCSVTYAEAVDLGIDNLEHGFAAASDFVPNKRPDCCPAMKSPRAPSRRWIPADAPFRRPREDAGRSATSRSTSTLPVFETFAPGRPMPRGLDVLSRICANASRRPTPRSSQDRTTLYASLFPKEMALERAFVRAGGMLVSGTDPSGYGGVSQAARNTRQIELLVEAGFTPVEAIRISTLNGARYLGRDARSARSPSASRPIWSLSAGTRRQTFPPWRMSRPCSRRAWATVPLGSSIRFAGASAFGNGSELVHRLAAADVVGLAGDR